MSRIFLLDGHCAAALAFARSLGRDGHWIAVGASPGSPCTAGLSRFCRARCSYPAPGDDAHQACQAVIRFAREHDIDLIVPLSDATVWPLALLEGEIGPRPLIAAANREALTVALDKYQTILTAQDCDVPVPQTFLVRSPDDLNAVARWGFPLVIKDRFSMRWVEGRGVPGRVGFADSWETLRTNVEQRIQDAGDVLVQEFCPGKGIGFSCLALEGEVHLPFQWQRVREKDPRGSGSSARMSLPLDPRISKYAERLLRAIHYTGLAMVEFKQRGEDIFLMEINARPWGSLQLPLHCGIDYPTVAVQWYLGGERPVQAGPYKVGITSRSIVDELVHLENLWEGAPKDWPFPYPAFVPSLLKMLIPWYPGLRYDDFWLCDLKPGIAQVGRWFRTHLASQPESPGGKSAV